MSLDPLDGYADVTSRMKALAVVRPLLDLDHKHRNKDWDQFQMAELGLLALDMVTLRMGLGSGARQAEVAAELAKFAEVQVPGRTHHEYREVGDWVLKGLMNVDDRNREFVHVVGSFADRQYLRRDFRFRILEDRLNVDGDVALMATDEAINVLVHAVDVDIASEQIAAEAKTAMLLRRGKWPEARREANKAAALSRHYVTKLAALLDTARRDVRSVNWNQDIEPVVSDAHQHLDECIEKEGQILEHVRGLLGGDIDRAQTVELQAVQTALDSCRRHHLELVTRLMKSVPEYLTEQDRQVFAERTVHSRVSLESQLLAPVMGLSIDTASSPLSTFFEGIRRPKRPAVFYLPEFLTALYDIDDTDDEGPVEVEDLDDVPISASPPRFSTAQEKAVARILEQIDEQGTRLSTLLEQVRHDTGEHDIAHLMALRCMQIYTHPPVETLHNGGRAVIAVHDHHRLEDPYLGGDDLLMVRPPAASPDAETSPDPQENM